MPRNARGAPTLSSPSTTSPPQSKARLRLQVAPTQASAVALRLDCSVAFSSNQTSPGRGLVQPSRWSLWAEPHLGAPRRLQVDPGTRPLPGTLLVHPGGPALVIYFSPTRPAAVRPGATRGTVLAGSGWFLWACGRTAWPSACPSRLDGTMTS